MLQVKRDVLITSKANALPVQYAEILPNNEMVIQVQRGTELKPLLEVANRHRFKTAIETDKTHTFLFIY